MHESVKPCVLLGLRLAFMLGLGLGECYGWTSVKIRFGLG